MKANTQRNRIIFFLIFFVYALIALVYAYSSIQFSFSNVSLTNLSIIFLITGLVILCIEYILTK